MSLNRYFTGGLLCLLGCNPANAQTATIVLSATLLPACEAGSVGSGGAITFGTLDFGQYASLNNAISATSQQGAGSIRVSASAARPMRSRSTAGSTAASPRGAWRTSPTPPSP